MKDHLQTILNICFAISITAFIYQNDKQQDSIAKLKNEIEFQRQLIDLNKDTQDGINLLHIELMSANEVNIGIAFDNFDIAKKNEALTDNKILQNTETIEYIQKYLSENFGNK